MFAGAAGLAAAFAGGLALVRYASYPEVPVVHVPSGGFLVPWRLNKVLTDVPTEWETLAGRDPWQTAPVPREPVGVGVDDFHRIKQLEDWPRGYASTILPRDLSVHPDNVFGLSL